MVVTNICTNETRMCTDVTKMCINKTKAFMDVKKLQECYRMCMNEKNCA